MANKQYGIYPANFIYAGPTTLAVNQVGSVQLAMNNEQSDIIPGGALDRAATFLAKSSPRYRLATRDIATVLGVVSPTIGLNCTGGAKFQYQQRALGGTFAGAGANHNHVSTLGFLWPESLSCSQDSREGAMLELSYCPLFDGTTQSIVATGSANLSGSAPAFNSQFFLGPCYVNSAQLEGLMSVKINFGIDWRSGRTDGNWQDNIGKIHSRRPMISLNFLNLDHITTIGSLFGAAAAGTVAIYLQRAVAQSQRVAPATATHFKLTATAGLMDSGDVNVQGEDDGTYTLNIMPTVAIATSLASAIP